MSVDRMDYCETHEGKCFMSAEVQPAWDGIDRSGKEDESVIGSAQVECLHVSVQTTRILHPDKSVSTKWECRDCHIGFEVRRKAGDPANAPVQPAPAGFSAFEEALRRTSVVDPDFTEVRAAHAAAVEEAERRGRDAMTAAYEQAIPGQMAESRAAGKREQAMETYNFFKSLVCPEFIGQMAWDYLERSIQSFGEEIKAK